MFLDKRKPWSFVIGREPIVYQQFGRYFLRSGAPADDEAVPAALVEDVSAPAEVIAPPQHEPEVIAAKRGPGRPSKEESLKIEILKVQMANFGEPWQGVNHAREFLGIA